MMKNRRKFLKGAAGVAALPLTLRGLRSAQADAGKGPITVVSWGGAFQDAYREAVWKPFMAETGIEIKEDTWNGEIAKVKASYEAGTLTWDMIVGDFAHAIVGAQEGFLVPIPDSILKNPDFYPNINHPYGVTLDIVSTVFAYDNGNIPAAWGAERPKSLADVWDLKRLPGKRGIRKYPKPTLEIALMAAGVPNDKVYATLSEPGGIDKALSKLNEIKEQSVFWATNAEAPQILARGEVVMTQAFNGRITAANLTENRKFEIVWDHGVWNTDTLIVLNTKNVETTMKLVEYQIQPEVQARVTKFIPYGPSRKAALPLIADDIKAVLPTNPANMTTTLAGVAIGEGELWWADHEEEAVAKFNQWLSA